MRAKGDRGYRGLHDPRYYIGCSTTRAGRCVAAGAYFDTCLRLSACMSAILSRSCWQRSKLEWLFEVVTWVPEKEKKKKKMLKRISRAVGDSILRHTGVQRCGSRCDCTPCFSYGMIFIPLDCWLFYCTQFIYFKKVEKR